MEEHQGNDKISILGIIYRSGSVDKIVLEEGYYDMANSRVEYTIHDHLGSPRVILSDLNGDGTISTSNMEVLDRYVYYPFGMEAESHPLHGISTTNEERYGNKERSAAAHAEILDYEARYYEPSIGRFLGVDPLAGDFPSWTPYHYVHNNPLRYIDPTGMKAEEPPYLYDGLYWEDEDGIFTRNSLNVDWTWSDCEGNFCGIAPSGTKPSGAIQPIGFVDAAVTMLEGALIDFGVTLGFEREAAMTAVTSVFIINDIKGLKVNKVIKNVDDLLDAAGSFKHKGSGTKSLQGENTLQGNMNDVFETITDGFETTSGGAKIHPDGRRIIHKHNSKNGPTITVDEPGELQKKIRFKDE